MNLRELRKNVGWRVQLEPVAVRLGDSGFELPIQSDDWQIQEVSDETITISNVRTHHVALLGKDHVHHFTTNPARTNGDSRYGFLTLNVQIYLQGADVSIRPNARPGERVPPHSNARFRDTEAAGVDRVRLRDERMVRLQKAWPRIGSNGVQNEIATFDDLSKAEKAELYETLFSLVKRGRRPKHNQFRDEAS